MTELLSSDTSMHTLLGQTDKHADSAKDNVHTDTNKDSPLDAAQQLVIQEHVHHSETADTTLEQEIEEHMVRNHSS